MKRCASITENDWLTFDWTAAEKLVFSLQTRIAEAIKNNHFNKVKVLQRILTNSHAAKMLAVKRVTQNKGKRTAGVDNVLLKTVKQKAEAVRNLNTQGYKPLPLRRIHILKKNGKTRPLGIPTMKDRAMQALFKMALEPVSESLADPCSHGFRMHRSCHDAVADLFQKLSRKNSPTIILEGDIKGCFDNISHPWLQENIPINKKILKVWLKCGFVEKGKLFPTQAGTPQGGIISPLLANMVLDGLQAHIYNALGVKFSPKGRAYNNKYQVYLIRYADDFVIIANNQVVLITIVKPAVDEFLATRGLQLSEEKTVITNTENFGDRS
jgi:RNA-directed DNA polymerase